MVRSLSGNEAMRWSHHCGSSSRSIEPASFGAMWTALNRHPPCASALPRSDPPLLSRSGPPRQRSSSRDPRGVKNLAPLPSEPSLSRSCILCAS